MKKNLFFLLSAGMLSLSSCITTMVPSSADVYVYDHIPLAPNVVLTVETPVIASPGVNYIWIEGYYTWDYAYRDYVWVPGHWEQTPYAGAYWIPGYWDYYGNGYRWVDAAWLPRNTTITYGYYNGRYDYYGRPVFYQQPSSTIHTGYAYSYDHRTEYRSKSYSSSPEFNNQPKADRQRVTQEYRKENSATATPVKKATTNRNTQSSIRVRSDETDTSAKREATPARTTNTDNRNTNVNTSSPANSGRSSSGSTTTRSSSGTSNSSRSSSSQGRKQ